MIFERAHLRLMAALSPMLLGNGLAAADVAINAVPPAENRAVAPKAAASRLVLPSTAPALSIALPAPKPDERGVV